MKIFEAKKIAMEKFNSSPIKSVKSTPALDADLLMSHVTGFDRANIILKRNTELSPEQERQFFSAVEKRLTGFPVAYIIGHKEFFGLDFVVTPDVLIPKPDTEILVEKAIEIIDQKLETVQKKNQNAYNGQQLKICDVCTGSGCVGISIIKNFPFSFFNFHFSMTDISEAALDVAQKNAKRLLNESQLANIKFLQGDLFDAVDNNGSVGNIRNGDNISNDGNDFSSTPETFNIIVSNPPYIPSTMVYELLKDGRSEPRLALDGDYTIDNEQLTIDNYPTKSNRQIKNNRTQNENTNFQFSIFNSQLKTDGLSIIRRLVPQAYEHLTDGGYFLCETGEYNAHAAAEIFQNTGFSDVTIFNDLSGSPRVVCGQKIGRQNT